jgi:cytidylate kinase
MKKLITIGREFGSGGREVGKRLAEILQIPYYDNEIVTQLAERTQLAEEYVQKLLDESTKAIQHFPITVGRSFSRKANPAQLINLNIHIEQGKLLRELAEKTDCVIVGRCANYVLRDLDPLRVFVYAEMESKIKRCREKMPEHEKLSDKELQQLILNVDKGRSQYYKFVTGGQWDDKNNYDILVNTTYYSIKEIAEIIAQPLFY